MKSIVDYKPLPKYCAYCGTNKISDTYMYDKNKFIYYYCGECGKSNIIGVTNNNGAQKSDLNETVYRYMKD